MNSLQKKSFTWLRARMKNHSMSINLLLVPFTGDHFFNFKKKLIFFYRFKYKAIEQDKKDMANPERVEGSEDQWMCPFCKKKDFFELSQVWSHFDATDSCKFLLLSSITLGSFENLVKWRIFW